MKSYTQLKNDITNLLKSASIISDMDLSQIIEDLVERVEFDVSQKTSAYKGIATPLTNPGVMASSAFYIAQTSGTYQYFLDQGGQGLVVANGFAILSYTGSYWEQTSYTIDLSNYINQDTLDRSHNYPFSDADTVYLTSYFRDWIKDIYLKGANPDNDYFISNFTYNSNNTQLTIEVKDNNSGALVCVFSSMAYVPNKKYERIVLSETNSSGISGELLLHTSTLQNIIIPGSMVYARISYKTYDTYKETHLSKFLRSKGTQNKDVEILDGKITSYDSNGNSKSIPAGNGLAGSVSFSGFDSSVVVNLTGCATTDIIVAIPVERTRNLEDFLIVWPEEDKFTLYRGNGGTENLMVNWIRIQS
jgi:hypothetical protein